MRAVSVLTKRTGRVLFCLTSASKHLCKRISMSSAFPFFPLWFDAWRSADFNLCFFLWQQTRFWFSDVHMLEIIWVQWSDTHKKTHKVTEGRSQHTHTQHTVTSPYRIKLKVICTAKAHNSVLHNSFLTTSSRCRQAVQWSYSEGKVSGLIPVSKCPRARQ